ncbi:hypothetical protein [Kiloniella litopenaei]|uniref:hypothetical protein n=1 Tax=Kiloniella litopenaei TaxID=1549748 RepID=UPI0012FE8574|nr:hypothetical protein [Kiloniella litopenaei]
MSALTKEENGSAYATKRRTPPHADYSDELTYQQLDALSKVVSDDVKKRLVSIADKKAW